MLGAVIQQSAHLPKKLVSYKRFGEVGIKAGFQILLAIPRHRVGRAGKGWNAVVTGPLSDRCKQIGPISIARELDIEYEQIEGRLAIVDDVKGLRRGTGKTRLPDRLEVVTR